MSTETTQLEIKPGEAILTMTLELSRRTWKVGFSTSGGRMRIATIEARDLAGLYRELAVAKEKFGLAPDVRVVSCHEAGRDGFWLDRDLRGRGIEHLVVDSSSIEVSRRGRRAKTDRIDLFELNGLRRRYSSGEVGAFAVVRVPSVEAEDRRWPMRELKHLKKERTPHEVRMGSFLCLKGIVTGRIGGKRWKEEIEEFGGASGEALGPQMKAMSMRAWERPTVVRAQIKELERQRRKLEESVKRAVPAPAGERSPEAAGPGEDLEACRPAETSRHPNWSAPPAGAGCSEAAALHKIVRLQELGSIGPETAWTLGQEMFCWRTFSNRRQVGAAVGMVGVPFASGAVSRDQGISKSGNRRVRAPMVELAWLWLRYRPDSALTRWFMPRFGHGTSRQRRVGTVALARKLSIALWRYVEQGVLPEGAKLKADKPPPSSAGAAAGAA